MAKEIINICQYIKRENGCEGVCTNPFGADTQQKQFGGAVLNTCVPFLGHLRFDAALISAQRSSSFCCYRPGKAVKVRS